MKPLAREMTLQAFESLGVVLEDEHLGVRPHRATAARVDGTSAMHAFASRSVLHPAWARASAAVTLRNAADGSANPRGYAPMSASRVAPRSNVPSPSSTPLPGARRMPPTFATHATAIAASNAVCR